jgi:hypothetical protein
MEYASYLSGGRWTDDPACTHPLLASLARQVNDRISDDARQRLLDLVPEVIGLTTKDLRADVVIALRAATTALPAVSEDRQRVMALAVAKCERLLADLEGQPGRPMGARSQQALAAAPGAAAWVQHQPGGFEPSPRVFRRQTAPAIVRFAVDGIWQACTPRRDALLREVLAGAIDDCRAYCPPAARTVPPLAPLPGPAPMRPRLIV